jgi:transcriptional regulator with XRE-family HTH domain
MTGDDIRALRGRLRLSQRQLAEQINKIDPEISLLAQHISRWENGHVTPSERSAAALQSLRSAADVSQGMDADTLAGLIRKHGVMRVGDLVGDFAHQIHAGLTEGWNFAGWSVNQDVPGVALFARRPSYGGTATEGVMVVNAPRSAWWDAQAAASPFPIITLYEEVVR